jgi:hypothetical protein
MGLRGRAGLRGGEWRKARQRKGLDEESEGSGRAGGAGEGVCGGGIVIGIRKESGGGEEKGATDE